jgi:hypothetical protein
VSHPYRRIGHFVSLPDDLWVDASPGAVLAVFKPAQDRLTVVLAGDQKLSIKLHWQITVEHILLILERAREEITTTIEETPS